jgi:hypothetical protein
LEESFRKFGDDDEVVGGEGGDDFSKALRAELSANGKAKGASVSVGDMKDG